MIATTSADPADLEVYVEAAGDGTARLTAAAAELRTALDSFRASEGRAAFLPDVPEVDLDLTFLARRGDRLAAWLERVAHAFAAADAGDSGVATLLDLVLQREAGPFRPPEVEVLGRDGQLVLDTGVGNDAVLIDDRGDELVVTVNGTTYTFALGRGDQVVVRLGAGRDVGLPSFADRPTRAGLVLDGGSGGDVLTVAGGGALLRGGAGDDVLGGGAGDDRLLGGVGADRLTGGAGDDHLLGGDGGDVIDGDAGDDQVSAGEGDDLVYGETGDDVLDGGGGRDHVDGGAGGDHIRGGADADIVSGGEGHDTVDAGSGDDVAYTGPGHDLLTGGSGADELHVEGDDVVAGGEPDDVVLDHDVDLELLDAIVIDPPEGAFADRVRSDLVTLASTVTGAALLWSLRGHTITVVADLGLEGIESDAYDPSDDRVQYWRDDDHPGFGPYSAGSQRTGPSYTPLVGLAHELVHAAHDATGTRVGGIYTGPDLDQLDTDRDGWVIYDEGVDEHGRPLGDVPVSNEERATVGLPVDHDEDPLTPDVPAEDLSDGVDITENDLRDELGLPLRGRY